MGVAHRLSWASEAKTMGPCPANHEYLHMNVTTSRYLLSSLTTRFEQISNSDMGIFDNLNIRIWVRLVLVRFEYATEAQKRSFQTAFKTKTQCY